MEQLIANTGIQIINKTIELDPFDKLYLDRSGILSLTIIENTDHLTGKPDWDYLIKLPNSDKYAYFSDVVQDDHYFRTDSSGLRNINSGGLPIFIDNVPIPADVPLVCLDNYDKTYANIYTINSLASHGLCPTIPKGESMFDQLLDKWLPIPLYEVKTNGESTDAPRGWCRLMIHKEMDIKGSKALYRLSWAIDTRTSDTMSIWCPFFDGDIKSLNFRICDNNQNLDKFFFNKEYNEMGIEVVQPTEITRYLASIFNVNLQSIDEEYIRPDDSTEYPIKYAFITYYIYLLHYLRHRVNLNVQLINDKGQTPVPVDLVLDIGNSRTCGILFENGDINVRSKLKLQDMTYPWRTYDDSFDMHFVIRRTNFGDIPNPTGEPAVFNWRSLVRVGAEARHLIYHAHESEDQFALTTNYSSPKRYLWDTDPFDSSWGSMVIEGDTLKMASHNSLYIPELTDYFDSDGKIRQKPSNSVQTEYHYSRSSMMTFVFIEIFNHAMVQINSQEFRDKSKDKTRKRELRNVIITVPTAMSNREQVRLRTYAAEAYRILTKDGKINVIPDPKSIMRSSFDVRDWTYDEATSCQLVYLYSQIVWRYGGHAESLFDIKGHVSAQLLPLGITNKSLTIGSIDIGAGTTDLMICTYAISEGIGAKQITPYPQFWDSFHLAGDDILRNIIQSAIIEGSGEHSGAKADISTIYGHTLDFMLKQDDNYFEARKLKAKNPGYILIINNILMYPEGDERNKAIAHYVRNLINDYFSVDNATMNHMDKRCRVDFNTQISMPIAQYLLEQLRKRITPHEFGFDDVFTDNVPAQYILDHFEQHFGYSVKDIIWKYDDKALTEEIRKTMEPLMKQLATVMYAYKVDILMLAGRPTSLDALTSLMLKFYPVPPHRLVCLNEFQFGASNPFADATGYIYDPKSIVAVGAFIGYKASHNQIPGFALDLTKLAETMGSKAEYIGHYQFDNQTVVDDMLTPDNHSVDWEVATFPFVIGAKQLIVPSYQARPLYIINKKDPQSYMSSLKIRVTRDYREDPESIEIESAYDSQLNDRKSEITLSEHTLVDTATGNDMYWLDNGAFKFL